MTDESVEKAIARFTSLLDQLRSISIGFGIDLPRETVASVAATRDRLVAYRDSLRNLERAQISGSPSDSVVSYRKSMDAALEEAEKEFLKTAEKIRQEIDRLRKGR
jgi:hypothetical protein